MNETTTTTIKTLDIAGKTFEVRADVKTVTREKGYSRGSVEVLNWARESIPAALDEVGTSENKTLVKSLCGMFDITLPSLRVKTRKHSRYAAEGKFLAVIDTEANEWPMVTFTIAEVGDFAAREAREAERQAKWEERQKREDDRRALALEMGKKAMADYAHLRITEMEVEVEGLVYTVKMRGWDHTQCYVEVSHSPENASRTYTNEGNGWNIKPASTYYPTDAERAAAAHDSLVMC